MSAEEADIGEDQIEQIHLSATLDSFGALVTAGFWHCCVPGPIFISTLLEIIINTKPMNQNKLSLPWKTKKQTSL